MSDSLALGAPCLPDSSNKRFHVSAAPADPCVAGAEPAEVCGVPADWLYAGVQAVLSALDLNSAEAVADDGAPLAGSARAFVENAAGAVVLNALLNRNFSIEDFKITPFASDRGGACIVIDYRGTGKRITLDIPAEGIVARVSMTSPTGDTAGEDICSGVEIARFVGWLTKPSRV